MSKETALLSLTGTALLLEGCSLVARTLTRVFQYLGPSGQHLHPCPGALPMVNYTSTATQEAEFPLHLRNDLIIKAY